jgi:hypothetical protein
LEENLPAHPRSRPTQYLELRGSKPKRKRKSEYKLVMRSWMCGRGSWGEEGDVIQATTDNLNKPPSVI